MELLAIKHQRSLYRIDFSTINGTDPEDFERLYQYIADAPDRAFFVVENPPADHPEALAWMKTALRLLKARNGELTTSRMYNRG